ncbi:DnaB-like helicase N-terminal domain-containing protein [Nocardia sp. NPDC003963]
MTTTPLIQDWSAFNSDPRISEQASLGSILANPATVEMSVKLLTVEDFSIPAHRAIYSTIVDLHRLGEVIDPVTVAAGLDRRGELADVGGADCLVEMTNRSVAAKKAAQRHLQNIIDASVAGGRVHRAGAAPMKAIETEYAGHRFRSRIEARWAVFFDTLEIEWEYEAQGFDLPSGRYLPDFWLPGIRNGIWYEVKGKEPTDEERNLAWELAAATGSEVVIASGGIPWPNGKYRELGGARRIFFPADESGERRMDEGYEWCIGPRWGRVGIEFGGYGYRLPGEVGGRQRTADHPRLIEAFGAGRGARFEHGETPEMNR